jgi:hypothetical protein
MRLMENLRLRLRLMDFFKGHLIIYGLCFSKISNRLNLFGMLFSYSHGLGNMYYFTVNRDILQFKFYNLSWNCFHDSLNFLLSYKLSDMLHFIELCVYLFDWHRYYHLLILNSLAKIRNFFDSPYCLRSLI